MVFFQFFSKKILKGGKGGGGVVLNCFLVTLLLFGSFLFFVFFVYS
jgi:hypothetical protein